MLENRSWEKRHAHRLTYLEPAPCRGNQSEVTSYQMLTSLKGKSTVNELLPAALSLDVCVCVCSVPMLSWPSDQQKDIQCELPARCHYTSFQQRKAATHATICFQDAPASSPQCLFTLFCHHNWGAVAFFSSFLLPCVNYKNKLVSLCIFAASVRSVFPMNSSFAERKWRGMTKLRSLQNKKSIERAARVTFSLIHSEV